MPTKKRVQKMQPETKQKILAAWDEEFKAAGLPTIAATKEQMEAVLKNPEQYNETDFVLSGLKGSLSWSPLAWLQSQIDQWDEPTPEELEKHLSRIRGKLRYEIRGAFAQGAKKFTKTLTRPPGGHPRSLTEEKAAAVCRDVAQLYKDGHLLRDAFKLVARKYKTSSRTIERTWRGRPKPKEIEEHLT